MCLEYIRLIWQVIFPQIYSAVFSLSGAAHTGFHRFTKIGQIFQNVLRTQEVDFESAKYYPGKHAPHPSRSCRLRHFSIENRSPFILDPGLYVESLTGKPWRHDRVQSNSQELQPCSRYALYVVISLASLLCLYFWLIKSLTDPTYAYYAYKALLNILYSLAL